MCRAGSACFFSHSRERPEVAEQLRHDSSGISPKSWADDSEEIWPQWGRPAFVQQDQPLATELGPVCRAWQSGRCNAGSSCMFRHGPNPCAVAIDNSSVSSSSPSWERSHEDSSSWTGPTLVHGTVGAPVGQEEEVGHWVWDDSASSSMALHWAGPSTRRQDSPLDDRGVARRGGATSSSSSSVTRRGGEVGRGPPDVCGADMPRFDNRLDIPEFFPDLAVDGGQLRQAPVSKSVKRKRQRKLNEKRRDMMTSNQLMLGPVVEALLSLSPSWIDGARQRLPSCQLAGPAHSPGVSAAPPPSPRWKVDRMKWDVGDGERYGEDLEDDVSG